MMISYVCVYKRSIKSVLNGSRVETTKAARKEYKQLLDKGWKKTSIFKSFFNFKKTFALFLTTGNLSGLG